MAYFINADSTNPFVNNLLGNDASTLSTLIFGPDGRLQASRDLLTSNPVKNAALDTAIDLAKQVPVGGTIYAVGRNVLTASGLALDMVPTSKVVADVVPSAAGRGLSKAFGGFTKFKLVFDAAAYINALYSCSTK